MSSLRWTRRLPDSCTCCRSPLRRPKMICHLLAASGTISSTTHFALNMCTGYLDPPKSSRDLSKAITVTLIIEWYRLVGNNVLIRSSLLILCSKTYCILIYNLLLNIVTLKRPLRRCSGPYRSFYLCHLTPNHATVPSEFTLQHAGVSGGAHLREDERGH